MPRVYCMHMQSEGLPTVYVCNDRDVIGSILRVDSSTFSLDVTAIEAPAEGLTCTVKGCVTVSNVWHYISNENSCVIGGECVHDITNVVQQPCSIYRRLQARACTLVYRHKVFHFCMRGGGHYSDFRLHGRMS